LFSCFLVCQGQSWSDTITLGTPLNGTASVNGSSESLVIHNNSSDFQYQGLVLYSMNETTMLASNASQQFSVSSANSTWACFTWLSTLYIDGNVFQTFVPHVGRPCVQNTFVIGIGAGTVALGYFPYFDMQNHDVQLTTNYTANMTCLGSDCVLANQLFTLTTAFEFTVIPNQLQLNHTLTMTGLSYGAASVWIDTSTLNTPTLYLEYSFKAGDFNSTLQLFNKTGPFIAPDSVSQQDNGVVICIATIHNVSQVAQLVIRFSSLSFTPSSLSITITQTKPEPPPSHPKRLWLWILIGVGGAVALLVIVAIIVIVARNRHSGYEQLQTSD